MKLLFSILLAATLMSPILSATAQTTSFRCKNDLVNVGDGKASALLKCGEPLVKDTFCKAADAVTTTTVMPALSRPPTSTTIIVAGGGCSTVDDWTYNPGYGQFMTTLRFESGKLTSISYGDRVK